MTYLWMSASLAHASGCVLTTGEPVAPGIPAVHAECHWADVEPGAVDAVLSEIGQHDVLFWMIASERVLEADGPRTLVHQRLEVSPLRPREASVWVSRTVRGDASVIAWELADEGPRPSPGAVRPEVNTGSWTVAPHPGGGTAVTVDLAYDPGGWVPAVLVRWCQGAGAQRALADLRAAALDGSP